MSEDYAPVQEMRLAVVMYGGVSLAVYMNGVAGEFLNLVRATAPAKDTNGDPTGELLWSDERLTGSMRVYRKLGRMLGGTGESADSGRVRTRFVIDIVTGTSAGGINGVFLAKALANQQEMDGLTRMWRAEGDLVKLLNDGDKPSVLEGSTPDALLNSRRILELFNDAIKGMKWDGGGSARPNLLACDSPYVEELDLFVTTTDMAGLLVPLRLEDRVIFERRYRNYYHFRYGYPADNGAPYNSFQPLNTTFLAFASRCTSAFPFAFAPMDLETAVNVCGMPGLADWTGFYSDYLNAAVATAESSARHRDQDVDFARRPFIDGGCLDNKPFSYAIDALRWKQSDLPVTRKLFYVEPAPAHPELDSDRTARPDALDSVNAGYVDLPRVENIREDLQRVLERNRTILRLRDALDAVSPATGPANTEKWTRTTLLDIREESGPGAAAYAAYHRMKVSAVTSAIASTVVCAAGLDADSDDALAIRYLVKAWRNAAYPDIQDPRQAHPSAAREGRTSGKFLLDFDVDYRVRRLSFVRQAIDDYARHNAADSGVLPALRAVKKEVNAVRRGLLRTDALARAHDPSSGNPLLPLIGDIAAALPGSSAAGGAATPFSALVQHILAADSDADRLAVAAGSYAQLSAPIQRLAEALASLYARPPKDDTAGQPRLGFFEASERATKSLEQASALVPPFGERLRLIDTYHGYESYDAASFPLLYGAGVGEVKEVEVVRISPDDATPLCAQHRGVARLAGDSLGHFGAFLRQSWREHDILWGRLDGADRILNGLAPTMNADVKAGLIREAQIAVLQDWCAEIGSSLDGQALYDLLTRPGADIPATAAETGNGWKLAPADLIRSARLGAGVLKGMEGGEAESFGGRALAVVSAMGEGLAGRRPLFAAAPLRLLSRGSGAASRLLTTPAWVWVAVAAVALTMAAAGFALGSPAVRDLGLALLIATGAAAIARYLLAAKVKDALRGG